jgi:hypothetical protein
MVIYVVNRSKNPNYMRSTHNMTATNPFDNAIATYISLLSTLHTFITSAVLSPFRCFPQFDGSYTLIPNPSEDCFSESWKKWIPVIVLGFIYIIAVPIALVWIFSLYRDNSKCQVWDCRYGHLIQPYKNRFFLVGASFFNRKDNSRFCCGHHQRSTHKSASPRSRNFFAC